MAVQIRLSDEMLADKEFLKSGKREDESFDCYLKRLEECINKNSDIQYYVTRIESPNRGRH